MRLTLILCALAALAAPAASSAQTYQLVRQWDAVGTSIAFRESTVYVLNAPAVDMYSATGSVLGSVAAEAQRGLSLAVDGDGFIYVNAGDIRKLDPSGAVVDSWREDEDGDAFHDSGVGVDAAGNIYAMADGPSGYRTVSRLGHNNANPLTFGDFEAGQDIAIGSDGTVYIAALGGGSTGSTAVYKYSADGTFVDRFGSDVGGITVDKDGFVFVALGGVKKFSPTGAYVDGWDVDAAQDVAVSDAGEVYVITDSRVLVYAPSNNTPVARVSFGQLKARWAR